MIGQNCSPTTFLAIWSFSVLYTGAGKTSTFNILIGDISPTSGTAIISGYDIRTDLRKVTVVVLYY